MGNHILVRMFPEYKFTDDDIKKRYIGFYGDDSVFADGQIPSLREKLSNLSEIVRKRQRGRVFIPDTKWRMKTPLSSAVPTLAPILAKVVQGNVPSASDE